jgi:Flp pilus assembly protein TadD
MVNYYNQLKVSPTASDEEIKKAINRELRVWSNRTNAPQMERRQEAEKMVKQLEEAERILLDAAKRKDYDLQLKTAPTEERHVDEAVVRDTADLVQEGWRLLIQGNIPDALFVATKATEKDASNPEAWALLGQAKYRWGDLEDAIYEYKRAVNLRPNEASYYFDLGCVYESAERLNDALLQFQRASQIDPSTTMYRAGIGIVLVKTEKFKEGIEILERCVQEEPDNTSYQWFLALGYHDGMLSGWWRNPENNTYLCISKSQADQALEMVNKAAALNFNDPEFRNHILESKSMVEGLYKRKFKGSWILVVLWGLVYVIPGALWYLANLRPQYKINRDIYEIIEMGKKDALVGGEVGAYFSALPPGFKWAAYSLPRFAVWALIIGLSPITFFYSAYDNYIAE